MNAKRSRTTAIILAAAAVLPFLPASLAIPPPRLPASPVARTEANLLNDYERKTLTIELQTLSREIHVARVTASQDPSLEKYRADLKAAEESGDAAKITDAKRNLANATEQVLYNMEGIPEKIGRLSTAGMLLRYDSQDQKELRSNRGPTARRLAKVDNTIVEIGPPPVPPLSGTNTTAEAQSDDAAEPTNTISGATADTPAE